MHFQGLGKNASLTTKNRFFKIILHILFQPIHLSSQLSQPAYTCQHFSNCPLALLSLLWSNFGVGIQGCSHFVYLNVSCICSVYVWGTLFMCIEGSRGRFGLLNGCLSLTHCHRKGQIKKKMHKLRDQFSSKEDISLIKKT